LRPDRIIAEELQFRGAPALPAPHEPPKNA